MANHKSSKKRIRVTETRRTSNKLYAKTMRNSLRDFRKLTDKDAATEQLPAMVQKLDKLAKKGVIHKNKVSNLKSKLMKRTHALSVAS
ncbi:30S ribosomal protein S20 [Bacteroidia bacterium]|nr:30S ribosomal protein S20 [Bacteroidia bacterium]